MQNIKHNKKEYQKITLVLVIFLFIFLVGCQSGSVQTYKVGTDGLTIEFASSNPKSIYEGENFGTALFVNNVGSANVSKENPGLLKISFDDYRLKFVNSKNNYNETTVILSGKGKNFPKGDELTAEFYFESLRLTHLRESSKTNINYNLCYPYNTEVTIVTCIDTKIANRDETAAACASETYNGAAGQGAPIVITKIVPEIMLQTEYVRPQFKIYIENKGNGYVTNQANCYDTNINDRNSSGRVNVYAYLSGKPLECGPDNSTTLRLVDGESFIRCYLPNNEQGYSRKNKNYLTPLTVSIDYTYTLITNQEIEIKRDDTLEQTASQNCNSYQILDNDNNCIDKCQFCINNSGDERCQENKPFETFIFGENFSCACTLQQCNTKEPNGNCIKGYCPGNLYCCSTNQCDKYQVEYNGKCLDKCTYCSTHSENKILCPISFNFTGFTCEEVTKLECDTYAKNKTCISGYCGGANINKYCINLNKI